MDKISRTLMGDSVLWDRETGDGIILPSEGGYAITTRWSEDGLCLDNFWNSLDPKNKWSSLTPHQRQTIIDTKNPYEKWELFGCYLWTNSWIKFFYMMIFALIMVMILYPTYTLTK